MCLKHKIPGRSVVSNKPHRRLRGEPEGGIQYETLESIGKRRKKEKDCKQ